MRQQRKRDEMGSLIDLGSEDLEVFLTRHGADGSFLTRVERGQFIHFLHQVFPSNHQYGPSQCLSQFVYNVHHLDNHRNEHGVIAVRLW